MKHRFGRDPVVIVGGGIAGLTAANLLARDGFAVTIFEASSKLGGCCSTTTVDGYTFNDGAVYLAVIGILDHAFQKVGLNRPELLPLRKISPNYSATLPDGSVVTLNEGMDLSVTGRSVDPIRLQRELRTMMDKWQPVLRFLSEDLALHPFSSWRTLRKGWRHLPKLRGTVASEFNRLFSDGAVRSALSGALLYCGTPAQHTPVSAILGLVAAIDDGFYLPTGGMGQVPQVLSRALQTRGVQVFLNSKVQRIVVNEGRVRAVEVKDHGRVDAAAVISSASAMLTFGSLLDAEHVPSAMSRKLKHAHLSHRAVSLQFGLSNKINPPAQSVSVLPWMEHQQDIFMPDGDEVKFLSYVVPTLTMPGLASRGGSIIEVFHPVKADLPLEHWNEARKNRLAESVMNALSGTYDLDVAVTRVRSPRDFLESMYLFEGALYGLSPTATPREQFPHRLTLPGLFLAGQTTFPGYGVGPAMISGIFAAEALAATAW